MSEADEWVEVSWQGDTTLRHVDYTLFVNAFEGGIETRVSSRAPRGLWGAESDMYHRKQRISIVLLKSTGGTKSNVEKWMKHYPRSPFSWKQTQSHRFRLIFKGSVHLVHSFTEDLIQTVVQYVDALLVSLPSTVLPIAIAVSAWMLWHLNMVSCILIFFHLTGVLWVWLRVCCSLRGFLLHRGFFLWLLRASWHRLSCSIRFGLMWRLSQILLLLGENTSIFIFTFYHQISNLGALLGSILRAIQLLDTPLCECLVCTIHLSVFDHFSVLRSSLKVKNTKIVAIFWHFFLYHLLSFQVSLSVQLSWGGWFNCLLQAASQALWLFSQSLWFISSYPVMISEYW